LDAHSQNLLQHSPITNSSTSGSVSINVGQQSASTFVLRKKFNYKTKYNLTGLVRDLEVGMRETCKVCELSVNYFSFTSSAHRGNLDQPMAARLRSSRSRIQIKTVDMPPDSVFVTDTATGESLFFTG
jgi:hypothetical protein